MKKIISIFFAGISLIFLVACEQQPTDYQYYATHFDVMKKTLESCDALSSDAASAQLSCVNARNAYEDSLLLSRELMQSPQQFGQKILAAENTLATLPKGTQAYQAQAELVERYLAIAKEMGE